MKNKDFYDRFKIDYEVVENAGFNPYYPILESGLDDPVIIDGKKFIDLASNNYLGLANDPRVKEAGRNAIQKYGMSLCATPVASGYSELYHRVREKLTTFLGLESSILYPSCYQANNGLFNVLVGREDVAIIDRCSHSSLIEGIRGSGCKIRPFLHNDMDYLEKILKKTGKYRQAFVITESVFSTEGDIAPFQEIVDLCDHYGAVPVVDDSHGIGVIGKHGKGILDHAQIQDYNGLYTASMGKALANSGGVISGKKSIIDYLKYYSSHLVYSTSLIPSALAGVEKVLEIIQEEYDEISAKMWRYKNQISSTLLSTGYEITNSSTAITSIRSGSPLQTLKTTKTFYNEGILSTPFIYPSVQFNEGRIRLIAGANLSEKTIDKASEIFIKLAQ